MIRHGVTAGRYRLTAGRLDADRPGGDRWPSVLASATGGLDLFAGLVTTISLPVVVSNPRMTRIGMAKISPKNVVARSSWSG